MQEPNAFDRLRDASKRLNSSATSEQPKKKTATKFVFKSKAAEPVRAHEPKQLYLDLGQSNFSTQTCGGTFFLHVFFRTSQW